MFVEFIFRGRHIVNGGGKRIPAIILDAAWMLIRQNASAPPGADMTSAEVTPGVSVGVSRLSKYNSDFEKVHILYKKNQNSTTFTDSSNYIHILIRCRDLLTVFITKIAVLIPQGTAVQKEISFMSCLVAQSSPLFHSFFLSFPHSPERCSL